MRKKLLSLALALVMCLGLTVPAFAAERVSEFTDVPEGAWYLDELDYAVYNAWLSGVGGNKVDPDGTITRGQFVTIMGRMFDAPTDGGKTAFEDVSENAFYAPYVAWASSKGYVNGFSVKEFGPNNNISVEQMAAILDNYIRKEGAVLTETPVVYTDMASVSRWAVSAVEAMARYNLLHVDASGNVNPQKQVSRAEAAVSLVRLAKSLNLGVVPPTEQTSGVVSPEGEEKLFYEVELEAAQKIHDELWASGKLNSSMSEKEKAIVYFDWMCMNCKYGTGESFGFKEAYSHTAYGSLVNGIAMCDGLSYGYALLLQTEGIECSIIPDFKNDHAYNEAVLDGKTYKIDMTNGVTMSKAADGSYSQSSAEVVRDKFFMDREEWLKKHFGPSTGG